MIDDDSVVIITSSNNDKSLINEVKIIKNIRHSLKIFNHKEE